MSIKSKFPSIYFWIALLIVVGVFYLLSLALGQGWKTPDYTQEEIDRVEELRSVSFDPRDPVVIAKDVDYSEGKSAEWYPKKQSPMLDRLVEDGDLPPLEERIGSDPMVLEGVDGVGKYGGTLSIPSVQLSPDPGWRWRCVGFVRWSPQGIPVVPYMAKSWDISEDKRVYTFHLREGLRWSDGHPFTTEDIIYAYEIDSGLLRYKNDIKDGLKAAPPDLWCGLTLDTKVEALDKHSIRFTFREPNGIFLYMLAQFKGGFFFMSPKHYLSKYYYEHAPEQGGYGDPELIERLVKEENLPNAKALYGQKKTFKNPDKPRLSPWICRTEKVTPPYELVRNPYFPVVDSRGNQLPYMDRVFLDYKDVKMLHESVSQGRYSFHCFVDGFVDYKDFMSQRRKGGFEVYHWYSGDSSKFTIMFNMNIRGPEDEQEWKNKHELFNDIRFRKAMSHAIDREAIIDALYSGIGDACQNMPRKESLFYNEEALYKYTEYKPGLANRLLDEAGYTNRDEEGFRTFKDGSPILIIFTILEPHWEGMARFVIQYWEKLGIRSMLVVRTRTLFDMKKEQQTYDIYTWNGNNEYYPLLDPRYFVPGIQCGYAPAYSQWYTMIERGFTPERIRSLKRPTVYSPPEGHPFEQTYRIYKRACRELDPEKQAEIFQEAVEIASENLWAISMVAAPATLAIVKNDLRNVPRTVVSAWDFLTPMNAYPETYFSEESRQRPEVIKELQSQILKPRFESRHEDSGLIGTVISWGFAIAFILFIIHACLRRPYIAHRLMLMIPTLAVISVIAFTMIQLPEGDYISNRIAVLETRGETVDPADIQLLKDMFFLDDPQVVRYVKWMGLKWFFSFDEKDKGLLQGFMGYSMQTQRPVNTMIGDRLLLTMAISAMTVLTMWIVSMPLGLYCAIKQYSLTDYLLTFIGFLGMCIPNFVLALFFIYMAKKFLGMNISGLFSPEFATDPTWSFAKVADLLKHIWVPIVVSAAAGTGGGIRGTRANMLDELRKPYVRTALAKGVHPFKVVIKYPFRMALNPFISGIGNIFPMLVSGGALIAIVLSLPTIGPLQLNAVMMQDMFMGGSLMMMFTLLGIIGTLVSDLLLLVLDPRIRYTGGTR